MSVYEPLFFIVPAYNEQENICQLLSDWLPIVESIEGSVFVVIDDGSNDNTLQILQSCAEKHKQLTVLSKPNGGHGDTLLFGYRYAINQGARYIFQTDSDGQTDATEFMGFWERRNDYDAIIGNRKKRGDGIGRKAIEVFLVIILGIIFRVKIPDANTPFRLMRADVVSKFINLMPAHYNLPNVLLTVCFARGKHKVLFKEITFRNRKAGQNSLNLHKIARIGIAAILDFIVFNKSISNSEGII